MAEPTRPSDRPPALASTAFRGLRMRGLPLRVSRTIARRLRIVALLSVVMWTIGLVLTLFAQPLLGVAAVSTPSEILPQVAMSTILVLVSLAVFFVAKSDRVLPETLTDVGLVFGVTVAVVMAVAEAHFPYTPDQLPRGPSWVAVWIVFYPVVVPSPPLRAAIAFLFAAIAPPAMLWVFERAGMTHPSHDIYVNLVLGCLLSWVLAVFATRIVHELGISVDAARDLGSYHLDERIGRGGMGEVWRARHKMLARPAAIKVIRPEVLRRHGEEVEEVVARFEKEAQATAALSSSHTVRLYDYGTAQDGAFYYVMELLQGIDLQRLVERYGPVPPERAIYLLVQVCHSLREAHALGLVHRDIKPSNLFLCRHGVDHDFVKVLDFGLVKRLDDRSAEGADITDEDIIPGTPAYMAPEELTGERPIDGRTDLYALGCVAYWLLTGHLVFEGDRPMAIALKHASETPEPPSKRTSQAIPAGLDRLVLDLLAKDMDARPGSATEVEERLRSIPVGAVWTERRAAAWWNEHAASGVEPA